MMEYKIMSHAHIDQVAELELACFSSPWSLQSIASELVNPLSLWIVATDGETVAGYIGSQTVLDEADMMNLAVDARYRRHGIAETLVSTLIGMLRDKKVRCLTLEVRESNMPAVILYEKLGFIEVGRRPRYYSNPKEDALIYRKEWEV